MPSTSHEAAHRIFQERPELLSSAFDLLGVNAPATGKVDVLSADATEIRPLERRVDCALRIHPRRGGSAFILAIEVQGRKDPAKEISWAYYQSYLGAKYKLPVLLLVLCTDRITAHWAAGPFVFGIGGWPAMTIRPLVLGPDNVPVVTKPDEAKANIPLAALAAIIHGRSKDIQAILEALAHALDGADVDTFIYYSDLIEAGLQDTPARELWRQLVETDTLFPGLGTLVEQNQLIGMAKGKAEGKAEGKAADAAEKVLRLLDGRGVAVSDTERQRVLKCDDLDTLNMWFDRAIAAATADEVFAEPGAEAR